MAFRDRQAGERKAEKGESCGREGKGGENTKKKKKQQKKKKRRKARTHALINTEVML